MISESKANYIAECIISLVDPHIGIFMVNGSFHDSGFSCNPIGSATFELSIVFYDSSNIGLFYIEDED